MSQQKGVSKLALGLLAGPASPVAKRRTSVASSISTVPPDRPASADVFAPAQPPCATAPPSAPLANGAQSNGVSESVSSSAHSAGPAEAVDQQSPPILGAAEPEAAERSVPAGQTPPAILFSMAGQGTAL